MKPIKLARCRVGLVVLGSCCLVGNASAITLNTFVTSIYQVGNGSQVNLGHYVDASTNYNRLFAGGSYVAACNAPEMMPTTGARYLFTENVVGGLRLTVTVPDWVPARVNMPGFYAATTRGTTLDCTYNWTSRAVEGGYSVGINGITFQTGNGERIDGGTQQFIMNVPGLSDGGGWTVCIP